MITTLNIDDDVLFAARELAKREGKSAGKVVSELARRALQNRMSQERPDEADEFFGFSPIPKRGVIVTNEIIDSLREDEGL